MRGASGSTVSSRITAVVFATFAVVELPASSKYFTPSILHASGGPATTLLPTFEFGGTGNVSTGCDGCSTADAKSASVNDPSAHAPGPVGDAGAPAPPPDCLNAIFNDPASDG